jgi:hypothetical protein
MLGFNSLLFCGLTLHKIGLGIKSISIIGLVMYMNVFWNFIG